MVIVTSPLMKDKVLKIVEEIEEIDVKHIKTEGINMYFETNVDDDQAISIIKNRIKSDPISNGIIIKVRKEYI
ncbi:hypothetical protein [uncultured Helcococcus sp.]|uniref:hypothetical protein n=1 Tax=uncultured Helcococcus sp. TaxID=1072508 RepID=UPI0026369683|nr:hypothetical protein [uncultured Helcococcus sp.]